MNISQPVKVDPQMPKQVAAYAVVNRSRSTRRYSLACQERKK